MTKTIVVGGRRADSVGLNGKMRERTGKDVSIEKWNKTCRKIFLEIKCFYLTDIILFIVNAQNPEVPAGGTMGTHPH